MVMKTNDVMFKGLLSCVSKLIEIKYLKNVQTIIPEDGSGKTFIVLFEGETEHTFIRI
jgi:hypothetical protein